VCELHGEWLIQPELMGQFLALRRGVVLSEQDRHRIADIREQRE